MPLKISYANWQPFRLCFNVLLWAGVMEPQLTYFNSLPATDVVDRPPVAAFTNMV